MKLIAHRGNLNGPDKKNENKPSYLLHAIEKGYYIELDLWLIDKNLYLGHDEPQYIIKELFLTVNKEKIFCHCKNIDALYYILKNIPDIECFYHQDDDCVLTSKGNIWTHYKTKILTQKSICVMPEWSNLEPNNSCLGICTDYPNNYK